MNDTFSYGFETAAGGIAPAGTGTFSLVISSEDFRVDAFNMNGFLAAAIAAVAPINTPLPRETPGRVDAANILPALGQIDLQYEVNGSRKMTSTWIPVNLLTGTGEKPNHQFRPFELKGGDVVTFTVRNNSVGTIGLRGTFNGVRNPG